MFETQYKLVSVRPFRRRVVKYFDSYVEAYYAYARKYATIGDRLWYWKCAHMKLTDVRGEQIMHDIMANVSKYAFIREVSIYESEK